MSLTFHDFRVILSLLLRFDQVILASSKKRRNDLIVKRKKSVRKMSMFYQNTFSENKTQIRRKKEESLEVLTAHLPACLENHHFRSWCLSRNLTDLSDDFKTNNTYSNIYNFETV